MLVLVTTTSTATTTGGVGVTTAAGLRAGLAPRPRSAVGGAASHSRASWCAWPALRPTARMLPRIGRVLCRSSFTPPGGRLHALARDLDQAVEFCDGARVAAAWGEAAATALFHTADVLVLGMPCALDTMASRTREARPLLGLLHLAHPRARAAQPLGPRDGCGLCLRNPWSRDGKSGCSHARPAAFGA